jgi:hypothetical protein
MRGIVGDDGNAEGGAPPDIEVIDLGDGDIEFLPRGLHQALDDLPLVFQRRALTQVDYYGQSTDMHEKRGEGQGARGKAKVTTKAFLDRINGIFRIRSEGSGKVLLHS